MHFLIGFLKIIGIQNDLPITFGTALTRIKNQKLEILPHTHQFQPLNILLHIEIPKVTRK